MPERIQRKFKLYSAGDFFTVICINKHKDALAITYFRCYTVHVVELLNYHTNHRTYIKFTH